MTTQGQSNRMQYVRCVAAACSCESTTLAIPPLAPRPAVTACCGTTIVAPLTSNQPNTSPPPGTHTPTTFDSPHIMHCCCCCCIHIATTSAQLLCHNTSTTHARTHNTQLTIMQSMSSFISSLQAICWLVSFLASFVRSGSRPGMVVPWLWG